MDGILLCAPVVCKKDCYLLCRRRAQGNALLLCSKIPYREPMV